MTEIKDFSNDSLKSGFSNPARKQKPSVKGSIHTTKQARVLGGKPDAEQIAAAAIAAQRLREGMRPTAARPKAPGFPFKTL